MPYRLIKTDHLTLDRKDRLVLVGTVEVTDEPGFAYDATIGFVHHPGGYGVEIESIALRARDGGAPITPAGVARFKLAKLIARARRGLPVYEPNEKGVLIVDAVSHRVEVGRHLGAEVPIDLEVTERPRSGPIADRLAEVAPQWVASSEDRVMAKDADAAAATGFSASTIRQWRCRYKHQWAQAVKDAGGVI